jgi:putative ABC transport system ATP-binding protein
VFQFGQLVPELSAADNAARPLLLNRVRRRAAYKTSGAWLDRRGHVREDRVRCGRAALLG